VTVTLAPGEGLENEDVQCALQEVELGARHGFP
jgi:hypothetical protein